MSSPATVARLRQRVAAASKTTFTGCYAKEDSLAEALRMDALAVYGKRITRDKYLINPSNGMWL